ncbi:MAG TPA: hypothetical protein VHE12_04240 [bacterium]|nr:hypothetical protein [bacterium]
MPLFPSSCFFLGTLFLSLSIGGAETLTPMESYNSLVAGGEDSGFQDGSFEAARFSDPRGLVFDDTGSRLFVADRENHRIRLVHLDEQNRVESLTGTGIPGLVDGPLGSALFNQPTALAFIPPDKLAVYDQGNQLLRLVDLKAGSVTTLGKGTDGTFPGAHVGSVWALAYQPLDNSLYFSRPLDHLLQRMELGSQRVSTVLSHDTRLPSPRALCVGATAIYAADSDLPTVYEVGATPSGDLGQDIASLKEVGKGEHILEMVETDGKVYALQSGGIPVAIVVPSYESVPLATVWGSLLDPVSMGVPPLFQATTLLPTGWAASPREPRKLYLCGASGNRILSVKDHGFEKYEEARSRIGDRTLSDFDYPAKKPPKTFRILVVGNSRVITAPAIVPDAGRANVVFNGDTQGRKSFRAATFPKQLEVMLNARASLTGEDLHFEVLTFGRPGAHIQYFAPEEAPDLARQYQVDLVLAFVSPFTVEGYQAYFERPLDADGIPYVPDPSGLRDDPEYILKPWKDRVPEGVPARFLGYCMKKGWIRATSSTRLVFPFFSELMAEGGPEVREDLVQMIGKPFEVLKDKLRSLEHPPAFLVCYAPSKDNAGLVQEDYRSFWRELCGRYSMELLDLTDPFNALKTCFYPVDENCCHFHYTSCGNTLIAALLERYLPGRGGIPLREGEKAAGDTTDLSPMDLYNNQVAGSEDAGFRDGPFFQARFRNPVGLAFDDNGSRLFVADRDNQRLRVVRLDQENIVGTLAGTGERGRNDGPLTAATFDRPSALAWVPPDHLAVFDAGSGSLRWVDLAQGAVTTLGAFPETNNRDSPLNGLWDIAYRSFDRSLYFTRPSQQSLQRMEVDTGKVSEVLFQDPRIPHPQALCVSGDRLFVADRDFPSIYGIEGPSPSGAISLIEAGKGDHVLELVSLEGVLYALQSAKEPWARVNPYEPLHPATPWGFLLDSIDPGYAPLLSFRALQKVGFAASSSYPGRVFVSQPGQGTQSIVNLKDYSYEGTWKGRDKASDEGNGILTDFRIPEKKGPGTFRILLVGDSQVLSGDAPDANDKVGNDSGAQEARIMASPRALTLAKQLEFQLNTQAALHRVPTHYEVLMAGHPGRAAQFFACSEVPALVDRYHVDGVLFLATPYNVDLEGAYTDYFIKPLGKDGVPLPGIDPEYLLKPTTERMPPGVPEELYRIGTQKGFIHHQSPSQDHFAPFGQLLGSGDRALRQDLLQLVELPLRSLARKLLRRKDGRGFPVSLAICYAPSGDADAQTQADYHAFWRELDSRLQVPFFDLDAPFSAMEPAFYPTHDACCHRHFTAYGNSLAAFLLSYYLPRQDWVPFTSTSTRVGTSK